MSEDRFPSCPYRECDDHKRCDALGHCFFDPEKDHGTPPDMRKVKTRPRDLYQPSKKSAPKI